jgi:hypothetical protein
MLIHAPEALRLRTTRSWWRWPLPRATLQMALYVAVCAASLGAAALVIALLLQQDGMVLEGLLAARQAHAAPEG